MSGGRDAASGWRKRIFSLAPYRVCGQREVMHKLLSALVLLAASVRFVIAEPLPTDHVFAPTSFWYAQIPNDAPLHTNSANFTADFLRQIKAYYGNVSINVESFASPVYVVKSNAPTVRVAVRDCQKMGWIDKNLEKQFEAVPIPSNATQAEGTDAEMTIWQPSTDTIWELWQAKKTNGLWEACWGGKWQNVSKSDGIFPNRYGTTATSLPFLGGQVTAEELQRGEIRHAIGVALVDAENWNIVSWPASRSDGWNPKKNPNQIPEGMRFRLNPAVNLDAIKLHPVAKTIAKAAQKYGFVVWDKAGSISIRFQNPKAETLAGKPNPYPALFNGTPQYDVFKNFPWDKLQFLPMNYGKP